jgi:hypothetical protein
MAMNEKKFNGLMRLLILCLVLAGCGTRDHYVTAPDPSGDRVRYCLDIQGYVALTPFVKNNILSCVNGY